MYYLLIETTSARSRISDVPNPPNATTDTQRGCANSLVSPKCYYSSPAPCHVYISDCDCPRTGLRDRLPMATLPMGDAESIKHVHPSLNARPMRSRSFEPRPLRQLWTWYFIPLRIQVSHYQIYRVWYVILENWYSLLSSLCLIDCESAVRCLKFQMLVHACRALAFKQSQMHTSSLNALPPMQIQCHVRFGAPSSEIHVIVHL